MQQFGIIGYPLSHSFSPKYFNDKFQNLKIKNANYKTFPLQKIEQLKNLLLEEKNLKGLNVTIPYKELVLQFLDDYSDVVKEIKACNCIKIENNKLYGYNTDVVGFENSLQPLLKKIHTKALILGTGGAAKAVEYVFKKNKIEYKFVTREIKAKNQILYNEISENIINQHLIIVNTSPLGMLPNLNSFPDIPYKLLTPNHICYDLIYNPEKTLFLKKSEDQNATIKNGFEMLIIQAEESWKLWNN